MDDLFSRLARRTLRAEARHNEVFDLRREIDEHAGDPTSTFGEKQIGQTAPSITLAQSPTASPADSQALRIQQDGHGKSDRGANQREQVSAAGQVHETASGATTEQTTTAPQPLRSPPEVVDTPATRSPSLPPDSRISAAAAVRAEPPVVTPTVKTSRPVAAAPARPPIRRQPMRQVERVIETPTPEPTVHVHIGRLDVRAPKEAKPIQDKRSGRQRKREAAVKHLDLGDYLNGVR